MSGQLLRYAALFGSLLFWLQASGAEARVERYAVIVGMNHGESHEATLRYAQSDAQRMYDVLRELGGFEPVNMVLLSEGSADDVRSTLITVNDRVRAAVAQPNTEAMLFVYYSGHADAESLHMGDTRLGIRELSQLVRGSAANFRMLVLDACQSGAATRRKGGHSTQPFAIASDPGLPGEGLALLTASAANEDAQESDELRASFFTHALVSGLLGAADQDRDGNVLLEEAYRYAYDGTLRATSRSASGMQHPSFFYDLRGQGRFVLTRPGLSDPRRGRLEVPRGASYLLFRDSASGQVVGEVAATDTARTLSLASGRYFLRGRSAEYLLEGSVEVASGADSKVGPDQLTRIEYAQLVRKGFASTTQAQAIEVGGLVRATLPNADTPCSGALVGYRMDLPLLALSARAMGCTSRLRNDFIHGHSDEYTLILRASHAIDLSRRFSLDLGAGAGVVYFVQRLETRGRAPTRRTAAGQFEAFVAMSVELARGYYSTLDMAAQTYVMRMLDARQHTDSLRGAFSGRGVLGVGKRF
jgi:hypothetical protein